MTAPSTTADTTPAAVAYVRWFAVMCWITTLGALFYLVTDYESVVAWVFSVVLILAVLPYLPLAFVVRNKVGLGVFTLFSGFMLVSLFFTPAGAYLLAQIAKEDVRVWFDQEPVPAGVSVPTIGGYAALLITTLIGLAVCVGLAAGCAWLVSKYVWTQTEIDNVSLVGDDGEKRAIHVPDGYTWEPRVHSVESFPFAFNGTYLDGREFTFEPRHPTTIVIWATWCPDCDAQLEALPTARGTDLILATLDCTTDGQDNIEGVKAKLRAVKVPRNAKVVCVEESELPFKPEWIPTSVMTDADGDVRLIFSGALTPMIAKQVARQVRAARTD